MNKTIKRITAAALAGVTATCMAVTASAQTKKCSCGKLTATLDVSSTTATATTSISDGTRGVTASIVGTYTDKNTGELKTYGTGNSWTAGVTVSMGNGGGRWESVQSTHSGCCEVIVLNW